LHKVGLFHGDIKPENIFYDSLTHDIYTDSGSIIFLKDHISIEDQHFNEDRYFVSTYTQGFGTKSYVEAIEKKLKKSARFLFDEDLDQLITS
jgi:serine/threonine protein kinase